MSTQKVSRTLNRLSVLKCHVKSFRNRTIEMTPMKCVYCDVKRLSQDSEIHIPCEIHVGVFHHDTSGDCKTSSEKKTLISGDD